jgi:hypothetical protein
MGHAHRSASPSARPSNRPDDFHHGREPAHTQSVSVAELAPTGAADGLVVHECPIGRPRVFDHDRTGGGIDDEGRVPRRDGRILNWDLDAVAAAESADRVATAREWPKVPIGVASVRDDKSPEDSRWGRLPRGLAPRSRRLRGSLVRRSRQGLCDQRGVRAVGWGEGLGRVRRRVRRTGRRGNPLGLIGARSMLRRRNRRRIGRGEADSIRVVRKLHLIERDGVSECAVARPPNDLVTELAARGRWGRWGRRPVGRRGGRHIRWNVRRLRSVRRIPLRRGRDGRVSRRGGRSRSGRDRSAAPVAEAVARLEHYAAFGAGAHRGVEHISYPRRAGHSPRSPPPRKRLRSLCASPARGDRSAPDGGRRAFALRRAGHPPQFQARDYSVIGAPAGHAGHKAGVPN